MIRISHKLAGMLGLLVLGSNSICDASQMYASIAAGSFSHDESEFRSVAATSTTYTSSSDDSDTVSVSWGVANQVSRFAIEYYYQTAEISGFSADYTKNSLFYSGYWTPSLFVPKLHGILGAGIGVSQLKLDSDDPGIGDDFSDNEAQLKVSVGLEYRITKAFDVFVGYEQHLTRSYSEWVTNTQQLIFEDSDQSCLLLGIAGRFD